MITPRPRASSVATDMPNLNPLRGSARGNHPPAEPRPVLGPDREAMGKLPPKIEVKFDTARNYSYRADQADSKRSLSTDPKGWNLQTDDGRPASASRVPRQAEDNDISHRINREKTPLSHLIMEVGPGHVQGQLSYKPVLTRPPTRLEKQPGS